MDVPMIVLVGVVALLLVVAAVVFMLQRSWGNSLPTHIEFPPPVNPARHQQRKSQPLDMVWEDADLENAAPGEDQFATQDEAAPDSGLILIEHPLLLQVIHRSLTEGGLATQYVIREGNDLYISLDLIQDPAERRAAAAMIQKFQSNSYPGAWDMLGLMTTFRRSGPH